MVPLQRQRTHAQPAQHLRVPHRQGGIDGGGQLAGGRRLQKAEGPVKIQQRLLEGDAPALMLLQPAEIEPQDLPILLPQLVLAQKGPAEMPVLGDVPGLEGMDHPGILLHPAADGGKRRQRFLPFDLLQHRSSPLSRGFPFLIIRHGGPDVKTNCFFHKI